MKKILALAFVAMMSIGAMAQTAQQVLDKTAAVIGNEMYYIVTACCLER